MLPHAIWFDWDNIVTWKAFSLCPNYKILSVLVKFMRCLSNCNWNWCSRKGSRALSVASVPILVHGGELERHLPPSFSSPSRRPAFVQSSFFWHFPCLPNQGPNHATIAMVRRTDSSDNDQNVTAKLDGIHALWWQWQNLKGVIMCPFVIMSVSVFIVLFIVGQYQNYNGVLLWK